MTEEPRLQRDLLKNILRKSGASSVDQLLFDPVTALPGLRLLVPQVEEALARRGNIGILTLNIAQFSRLEDVYGWELFDEIVRGVAACLQTIKDDSLRQNDALAELTINGNVFILMLSPPRTERALKFRDLLGIKARISEKLNAYVAEALSPELLYRFNYFIGCAIMGKEPSVRLERMLYRSIDEALADATSEKEKLVRRRSRKLREIIARRRITTHYQPVMDLHAKRVIGYEALSRGPVGEFGTPDVLFRIAYEAELVLKLDAVCRGRALRGLSKMDRDQILFINMEPLSIFDPALLKSVSARRAGRVVFEITEHAAISDFSTFRQAVQLLKQSGFKVALDDVGSAYSGLRIISQIEPDYIKLDMELTRAAQSNRVKMELVRAIAGFCTEASVPMIVEGVETREELEAVTSLGVHLVQGFLLGRPAAIPGKDEMIWPALDPPSKKNPATT
ncbi:MAG TPA: GGDEF domain-containing phosphodiesterase [Gemmatimonadaceae bacterium]|nr:GGDEF domain-containing phosphodiesterase [Gemmatimonadaceae bacterium]